MTNEAPVWQELLKRALFEKSDYSVAFALGTIALNGKPSVRYVGLKEVISLPSPPSGIAQPNNGSIHTSSSPSDGEPEVSVLVFTTDIRSPKCAEIQRNPACSLSTWSPETGIQLRIDGTAYIYKPAWSQDGAHPPNTWRASDTPSSLYSSVSTPVESLLLQRGANLEVQSRALFDGLHARTRAWHTRGTPGAAMDTYSQAEKEKWLEELQAGGSAETEAARNFALLLVVPEEVDIVQIVPRGHDRRWHWKMTEDMAWTVTELVP